MNFSSSLISLHFMINCLGLGVHPPVLGAHQIFSLQTHGSFNSGFVFFSQFIDNFTFSIFSVFSSSGSLVECWTSQIRSFNHLTFFFFFFISLVFCYTLQKFLQIYLPTFLLKFSFWPFYFSLSVLSCPLLLPF